MHSNSRSVWLILQMDRHVAIMTAGAVEVWQPPTQRPSLGSSSIGRHLFLPSLRCDEAQVAKRRCVPVSDPTPVFLCVCSRIDRTTTSLDRFLTRSMSPSPPRLSSISHKRHALSPAVNAPHNEAGLMATSTVEQIQFTLISVPSPAPVFTR